VTVHGYAGNGVGASRTEPEPRANRSPGKPVAFPIIIKEITKNSSQVVRIAIDQFKGKAIIDVRVWYRADGELKPSPKGITPPIAQLGELSDALADAADRAVDLDLVAGGR
jgi:hypothetical protein